MAAPRRAPGQRGWCTARAAPRAGLWGACGSRRGWSCARRCDMRTWAPRRAPARRCLRTLHKPRLARAWRGAPNVIGQQELPCAVRWPWPSESRVPAARARRATRGPACSDTAPALGCCVQRPNPLRAEPAAAPHAGRAGGRGAAAGFRGRGALRRGRRRRHAGAASHGVPA